jgi:PAS domain S-box-containing protein
MRTPEMANPTEASQKLRSLVRLAGLVCLVAIVCYFGDRLVYVLGIPPTRVASFWPATPFLVAVLLLSPRKIWPALLVAGLAALALADFKNGVTVRAEIWITIGNLIDALMVSSGIYFLFSGVPKLNRVTSLAKYLMIAVIFGPTVSALVGANCAPAGGYWLQWRLWAFADALGFLTVTPAILCWFSEGPVWIRKFRNIVELAALLALLVFCGYLAFVGTESMDSAALLYSLVPLLLWGALRLGVKGASTSAIVIALVAIWGAAHDRGPFTGLGPLNNSLSLQLFLFFATIPFMVLAVVVEEENQDNFERRIAEQALRESQERLSLATEAARMFAYEWDLKNGVITRSRECTEILGLTGSETHSTAAEIFDAVHPDDRNQVPNLVEKLRPENPMFRALIRVFRPDGNMIWLERTGRAFFDVEGKPTRLIGMAIDVTERKRSEETLRESEERFRNIFEDAGVGMVIVSPEGRFLSANETFCRYLGYTEEELQHMTVESVTQPDDWPKFSTKLSEALITGASFRNFPKRCRHKSGRTVYTESSASLIRTPTGEPKYFVGEILDVTERKMAQESLANANRRLIEAQEEERTRIARDLHDDINQRLALQAVKIQQIMSVAGSSGEVRKELDILFRQTQEISADIQSISHHLHPSKLKYLGIVIAMRGLCRENAQQHGVDVHFSDCDVPKHVPWEASICLFRVLQEALHNAVKHSGVRRFEVKLNGTPDGIHLVVSDSGVGFDPQTMNNRSGLGLVSMRERMRLVQGILAIRSTPGNGTTIDAFVPKGAEDRIRVAATASP